MIDSSRRSVPAPRGAAAALAKRGLRSRGAIPISPPRRGRSVFSPDVPFPSASPCEETDDARYVIAAEAGIQQANGAPADEPGIPFPRQ
jgi:hypothetical protein